MNTNGYPKVTALYHTIRVRTESDIGYLQIHRPDSNNTINSQLIAEMTEALVELEDSVKIVVIEGLPDVFCFGADFKQIQQQIDCSSPTDAAENIQDPEPLYTLWQKLATGSFLSIAHVRGKTNAGGMGFVAACDLVLCEEKSIFSLSELLFDLIPACVLPFLVRRIGFSNANYVSLMTQPFSAAQAKEYGLVDAYEESSENLLRKHLVRLRRLSKKGITQYKEYMSEMNNSLQNMKQSALKTNEKVFSDRETMGKISRYVTTGQFPWEDP